MKTMLAFLSPTSKMSTVNSSTTTATNITGTSSTWQAMPTTATTDHDHYRLTWRNVAAMLTSDNQLRNTMTMTERKNIYEYYKAENDDEYCCKRYSSSFGTSTDHNIIPIMAGPLRNLSVKMQHVNDYPQKYYCWYKTLPPGEMLPRNEVLGGYIFVCNNETMQEDLHRQLFGLPQKYKDSVRAITPGLPLFLYNYTSHQLHGVFQAVSFGGSNIDPTAWEDKKSKGESRFPAQVRAMIKKKCKPLEEDAFRPVLYHYDGPKFRLQLSVPEALALLDLFKEEDPLE
ncbi:hypothetical protein ACOSP7_008955 [Xanthoceras sorbifolium]